MAGLPRASCRCSLKPFCEAACLSLHHVSLRCSVPYKKNVLNVLNGLLCHALQEQGLHFIAHVDLQGGTAVDWTRAERQNLGRTTPLCPVEPPKTVKIPQPLKGALAPGEPLGASAGMLSRSAPESTGEHSQSSGARSWTLKSLLPKGGK